MIERLRELILHPDPDAYRQGIELAHAAGTAVVRSLLEGTFLDAHGTLWPPPGGWSEGLLELVLGTPPPGVRGLQLSMLPADAAERILDRLPGALPDLQRLDLGGCAVRHIAPLRRLPGLTALSLRSCRALRDIAPLADLPRLRELDLAETLIRDLTALQGLSALEALNLEGCHLTDGLRPVPAGVRSLRLRGGILEEPLQLAGRPIAQLTADSLDWLPRRVDLPALRALGLDRGHPHELHGWPVVRLWLRAPEDVDTLPLLRWLRVEGDPFSIRLPADLAIIEPVPDLPATPWWSGRVCPPDLLRALPRAPEWHPLRDDADRFWQQAGCTARLSPLTADGVHRVSAIRQLRRRYDGAVMHWVRLIDALAEDRLGWLRPAEAVRVQGQLRSVGLLTARAAMPPPPPPAGDC